MPSFQSMKSTFTLFIACAAATVSAAEGGAQWLTYNNDYDGQRWSGLAEINAGNVASMRPLCKANLGDAGAFQSGPVVVDDVLYVTTANTTVAMRATTCEILWQNVLESGEQVLPVNRGVAYADGVLFRGTGDARLIAIDAASGKTKWDVTIGDPKLGEFVSSAPIAWKGRVYAGVAGSDWGIRGHVMAFDAATGKEVWRFYTVPRPGEPGAETWHIPETATHGGGGQWTSYALDTATGELFVPVANPAPDYMPNARPGDNLYTNSVVVLDAASGKLAWYHQMTPADGLDYDLAAAPLIYAGRDGRAMLAAASKDGHIYGIDRKTHQRVFRTPVTTIKNAGAVPTTEGVYVCPGSVGGVEWNGPAFDPTHRTLYVGAVDWCTIYTAGTDGSYNPADGIYMGTKMQYRVDDVSRGWVTAVDADTGAVRWKYEAEAPVVAAVTPTAGNLVFAGDANGNFVALGAADGRVLYRNDIGGSMGGGIVTYASHGRQYVAATSGNVSRSGLGVRGAPQVTVFALPRADDPKMTTTRVKVDVLRQALAGKDAVARGKYLYMQFCSGCHGAQGAGGLGPDLRPLDVNMDHDQWRSVVTAFVKAPAPDKPMPRLHPNVLTEQDLDDIIDFALQLPGAKHAQK